LLNLAPIDVFHFLNIEEELVGMTLTQETKIHRADGVALTF
jgi:hypothetical protein